MDKSEYTSRFDRLYHYLLEICNAFHAWKGLQDKNYESIYDQSKYFWSAVLIALQNDWLLGLAKCFEESKYSEQNKIISVYALIKHHPDKNRAQKVTKLLLRHKKIIDHVLLLRHHQLAHLNAEHLVNPKKLLDQFPIVYGEVEALLSEFPKLLSLLSPESGHGYVLDNYTKEPESEAKYTMDKISYFNKKRKEHLDKFVSGEINDPNFPPEIQP